MNQEILHRAKDKNGNWIEGLLFYSHGTGIFKITHSNGWVPSYGNPDEGESTVYTDIDLDTVQVYTTLKDKKGNKVFYGQKVRLRYPARNQQALTSDNILESYIVPLEPVIREVEGFVKLVNCCICIVDENDKVLFQLNESVIEFDLDSAKEGFVCDWGIYSEGRGALDFKWNVNDEGDLPYLLEEYNLNSEEELVKYLGLEVLD